MVQSRRDRHKRGSNGNGKTPPTGNQRWWQRKGFKWGLGIFLVLLIAVIGYYVYSISSFVSDIHDTNKPDETPVQVETWSGHEPVNILLMGVDNRNETDKHPRSDTMLIVNIDPDTKQAKVMSVMRDTWLKIPGYNYEKINAAHALGGPDLTIRTLKEFLQIPIHYYVRTDFEGFIKIVDALGGIDLNVEIAMSHADDGVYDINLQPGMQHLDGQHALMYVRYRGDARADYARTERQRNFLSAVASEMSSPAAIMKLPSILSDVKPYITTNMSMSDMIALGKLALDVKQGEIATMQVPPTDALKDGYVSTGQLVVIPNVAETRKQVYEFLNLDPADIKEDEIDQPQEYYQPDPVVPANPDIEPEAPEPAPEPEPEPEQDDKQDEGTTTDPNQPKPGEGTGGTTKPGTGGTTNPGTGGNGGTGGTTNPGTGGTGGTTKPTNPGTGATTDPGTGGNTGGGTGGTTDPGAGGTGGTTDPGTGGTGGTTDPGTGGNTGGGTGGTGGTTPPTGGTAPGGATVETVPQAQ